ncbi:MAG TPA: hypothetical protein VM577_03230 [Anaerovoracaceae bacterium]|nr:hypothetical protein [Anaerovoracaceae bacterium]
MKPSNFITPGRLKYKAGDATIPESAGHRIIMHICNDIGGWGRGFVLALSKRWKKPEEEYRRWFRGQINFKLGAIQEVEVQSDTTVINMIAQRDVVADENGVQPLRLEALETCLDKVGELAVKNGSSIHAPRIGAGLAAGIADGYDKDTWAQVETLIIEKLIKRGINVTIYDLPPTKQESKG